MIVCVCNNVSEKKIRHAVDAGMGSMRELRDNLGVAACCGKCHACAKNVLRECLDNNVPAARKHIQDQIHALIFQPMPHAA
ncbi:(2Fe-2S)-binding protein [Glaciimonas soli]|uniref:Bacterioferritin-associated ferredoxin n=1 Tax=Glaciimonas soli TaxID=2590999 RepID=A0A843YYC5_9BURK|nr:(2Fe-2S)-binding protein [Glaciimonas soli]MQR02182.1 regulatory or redox protein complexing with Bfr, in iron storage and mobility [Glaciimonas soli]